MAKVREFAELTDDELDDALASNYCEDSYDAEDDRYFHDDACVECKLQHELMVRSNDASARKAGGFTFDTFEMLETTLVKSWGEIPAGNLTVGTLARYSPTPGISEDMWAEVTLVNVIDANVLQVFWKMTNTAHEFCVFYDIDDELDVCQILA